MSENRNLFLYFDKNYRFRKDLLGVAAAGDVKGQSKDSCELWRVCHKARQEVVACFLPSAD